MPIDWGIIVVDFIGCVVLTPEIPLENLEALFEAASQ